MDEDSEPVRCGCRFDKGPEARSEGRKWPGLGSTPRPTRRRQFCVSWVVRARLTAPASCPPPRNPVSRRPAHNPLDCSSNFHLSFPSARWALGVEQRNGVPPDSARFTLRHWIEQPARSATSSFLTGLRRGGWHTHLLLFSALARPLIRSATAGGFPASIGPPQ